MAVVFPPDVFVDPADKPMLLQHMMDKPGDWKLFSSYPAAATYTFHADVGEAIIQYKVQLDTSPVFDANAEDLNGSTGKRFGDGQIVARIPDHLLYSPELKNIGQAANEGDWKHVNRVLNDGDFSKLRTFRGKL
jgi:hypothetical protein